MEKKPILFLIFNRPDLTQLVFNSIKKEKPAKLFIAADGPREDKIGEVELCEQTRKVVLDNIDWDCEVQTLFRDENIGCKIAVSSAITWFFDHVEEGIILEDDILPDESFFSFCSEMLTKYKYDDRITQISGVNLKGSMDIDDSYLFSKIGGIWGWATWKRSWKHYDVAIKSWNQKSEQKNVATFLESKDWFNRIRGNFDMVYNNNYDTWDFQWVYTQLKSHGLAIIPRDNLIENLGFRPDATHTTSSNELIEKIMIPNRINFPLKHPVNVVSNYYYTAYYFSLLAVPQTTYSQLKNKIKKKLQRWFSEK